MAMPKASNAKLRDDAAEIEAIIARDRNGNPTRPRRVSEIKNELGDTMNQYVAVYRD